MNQHPEYQYLNLLQRVLREGTMQANRTGTPALTIDGGMMQFDLTEGFPIITTKKVFYEKGFAEQVGFLRAYDNVEQFEELGCNWWAKDANENSQWLASPYRKGPGDLGRIYGVQWRKWRGAAIPFSDSDGFEYEEIDQVQLALDAIRNAVKTGIASRRIAFTGWRPDEFDQMALPPCHVTYRFMVNVEKGELNMSMEQRSCDMFLGVPMNIINSALTLHLFAAATGLTAKRFTHFLSDVHIYQDHIEQVQTQLQRQPLTLPSLAFVHDKQPKDWTADDMAAINPKDIFLIGYNHHAALAGKMSTA